MKIFTGTVTSAKLKKSVTVEVARSLMHPLYGKRIKRTKNYLCHTEIDVQEGDIVEIKETRPMSKNKYFIVVRKIGTSVIAKAEAQAEKAEKAKEEKIEKAEKVEKEVKPKKKRVAKEKKNV